MWEKFILISICIGSTFAQIASFGSCPTTTALTPKSGFVEADYSGKWYSIEQTKLLTAYFAKCTIINRVVNTGSVTITTTYKNLFGSMATSVGTAILTSTPGLYDYTVSPLPIPMKIWILDTDYANWAVSYLCFETFFIKWEIAWVLSRTSTLTQTKLDAARAVLTSKNIPVSLLSTVDQSC